MEGRRERGEILFTEYGVSGIAAMQLSRFARPGALLEVDFLCGERPALAERARLLPARRMEDFLNGIVPRRIGQVLVKSAGISLAKTAAELTEAEIRALEAALTGWTLPVRGARDFKQAQVTAGGLEGALFDPQTLESRRVPGLYAAGGSAGRGRPLRGLQPAMGVGLGAARRPRDERKAQGMIRISQLKLPLDYEKTPLAAHAARALHCAPNDISAVHLRKRSVDARDKGDHTLCAHPSTWRQSARSVRCLKAASAFPRLRRAPCPRRAPLPIARWWSASARRGCSRR